MPDNAHETPHIWLKVAVAGWRTREKIDDLRDHIDPAVHRALAAFNLKRLPNPWFLSESLLGLFVFHKEMAMIGRGFPFCSLARELSG